MRTEIGPCATGAIVCRETHDGSTSTGAMLPAIALRLLGGPLTRMLGEGTLIAGMLGGGADQPTSNASSSSLPRLLFGGGGTGARFGGGAFGGDAFGGGTFVFEEDAF